MPGRGLIAGVSDDGVFLENYSSKSGYYYTSYGAADEGNIVSSIAVTNNNGGSLWGGTYGLYAYNDADSNYNGGTTSNSASTGLATGLLTTVPRTGQIVARFTF